MPSRSLPHLLPLGRPQSELQRRTGPAAARLGAKLSAGRHLAGPFALVTMLLVGAAAGCGAADDSVPAGGAGSGGATGGAAATGGVSGTGGGVPQGTGGSATGSGGAVVAGTGGFPGGGGGAAGQAAGLGGGSIAGAGAGTTDATGGAGGAADVSACTTNEISTCTGTNPVSCHFGGAPGNYEVTVELGGATAGDTYVDAEAFRRMVAQTTTAAGQTKRFSFVTNVRVYEAEPLRPDDSPTDVYTAGIAGLDIYFRGPTPKVTSICHKLAPVRPVMLWIAGDSTVTDQQLIAFAGWGQHLPQHFLPPISVANYADSGETSGSSLGSPKLFGAIKAGMRAGDWVFIQFGHNDEKSPNAASYRSNLTTMVNDAKAVGANAVLVTPISRVGGTLATQHVAGGVNYPQIVRDLGTSLNVPVVDLTVTTWNWIQTIRWQDYFANGTDMTHTNHLGADVISGFVRDAVRAKIPALAQYLR